MFYFYYSFNFIVYIILPF